jgi:ribosomal protein S18 acetylase RimI-like enzyme
MAAIRAREWQTAEFWTASIGDYLAGTRSPQKAMPDRAVWVALEDHAVVGFVAGHLTTRFGCQGELQWINVLSEHRGKGIAGSLMNNMLEWFRHQNAFHICVDVEPQNSAARALYASYGAVPLSDYWMHWRDLRQMSLLPPTEPWQAAE